MANIATYAGFETKDRMFQKLKRNINGLEIHIDHTQVNPVFQLETGTDEFVNFDDDVQNIESDESWNGHLKRTLENGKIRDKFPIPVEQKYGNADNVHNLDDKTVGGDPQGKKRRRCCHVKRKWFVLLAGFILVFMCTGIPFQLSILYVELLDEFEASNAETSLVQAVCTGTFFGGGFLSGIFVSRYGIQVTGTVSGLISATGLCLSFVAPNIPFLVVTLGVTTGYGFCLAYVCSTTSVGIHFVGRGKLMALSFVSFGSGVGAMSFSYILEILIQMYGWRGTMLILGGMTLNFIPAALVCVPVKNKPDPETRNRTLNCKPGSMLNMGFEEEEPNSLDTRKKINNSNTSNKTNRGQMNVNKPISAHRIENKPTSENMVENEPMRSNEVSYVTNGNGKNTTNLEHDYSVRKNAQSTWKGIKTVSKNRTFLLYLFGVIFCLSGFNCVLIFLIDFYQSKGLDRSTSVFLLFILNTVSAGGRFVPGVLKTIPRMSILTTSALCCASGCVSAAMFPFSNTYPKLIVVSSFYGLSLGGGVTIISVGTMRLVGVRYYSTGLGVVLSMCSVGVISAGPVSGKLRDISGSYDLVFYTTAFALGIASVIFALTALLQSRSRKDTDEFRMDNMVNRRMSRRKSSVLPWRRSLEFVY